MGRIIFTRATAFVENTGDNKHAVWARLTEDGIAYRIIVDYTHSRAVAVAMYLDETPAVRAAAITHRSK